jgi:integrase
MTEQKKRRTRGEGGIFRPRPNGPIWICYNGPDGKQVQESSGSKNEGVAKRLLRSRVGAREHNLPVVKNAEKYTFTEAAQAVIDDFTTNGKRSLSVVQRRIDKHLTPFFGGRRLVGIGAADVTAYVAHRQKQGITNKKCERIGDVSNSEINRELQILKRIFSMAIGHEMIARKPKITMLKEPPARAGFFEREQFEAVVRHLGDAELQPVIEFAYITGWRVPSEVLPLEWRQVDFAAGEVRLDAGRTKNDKGRVFVMTSELRRILKAQQTAHEQLKKAGHIIPNVFWRMVAEGRGGPKKPQPIVRFDKAWKKACRKAGCPGSIPHDMRRTAVRNLVRAGVVESVAMKMTGHLTRSVFERYNIVSAIDLREAAAKLDAVTAPLPSAREA